MKLGETIKERISAVPASFERVVRAIPGTLMGRLKDLFSALTGFHLVSLIWTAFLISTAILICFRGIIHAGMFSLIPLDETPSVRFLNENYSSIYWGTVGAGLALLVGYMAALFRGRRTDKLSRYFIGSSAFLVALVAFTCRFSDEEAIVQTQDLGFLDWVTALVMPVVCSLLMLVIGRRVKRGAVVQASPITITNRKLNRNALVYLLGTLAVFLYVIPIHAEFWELDAAHGVVYTKFLKPDEVFDAHVVLYSCSFLFSSVAAVCALFAYRLYKRALSSSQEEDVALSVGNCRNVAAVLGFAWSFAFVAPWMLKVWPDVVAEDGEVLLPVTFMAAWSSIIPLIYVSLLMLKNDDDQASAAGNKPGLLQAEASFVAFSLAPFYPWIRLFWPRKKVILGGGLILLSAVTILYLADYVDNYEVDGFDFRDTMRKSQIPFLRVYLSLALAWLFYIVVQRLYWVTARAINALRRRFKRENPLVLHRLFVRSGQISVVVMAALVAVASSLPLWFWDYRDISLNTYARCVEHSSRHEFELIFLHNVFDLDQDGYSSLLHGGDPDDFDGDITATGFPPLVPVDLPVDTFEIADEEKAKAFPNFVLITLEGVAPATLSCYGQRRLDEGRVATPHMDSIAKDGTIFTNARAAYPSTWDAWLMMNSGRYLRVTEMSNILSFEDRYSKHNNLRKVFHMLGTSRWAHAHAAAYTQMMVGPKRHEENFENEEYADISEEETKWGMYRGDRNLERVIRFIDSLKPGERFFLYEHMQDTHFPWKRTSENQAKKMGYEDGLAWVEKDGIKHSEDHLCYLQEVTRMDWQIGQIIKSLKDKKLYDNSMIVVMGDHGSQWLEHGHLYYPGHIYDPALRIPVIIKFPGMKGGGSVDSPVTQMDLLATVLELAGLKHTNEDQTGPFPGCSLAPFLAGTETDEDRRCCSERDMILTTHYDMVGYIERFKYKLIVDRPLGCYFLFDLVNDPGETENLADSHPELLEHMLEGMREQNRLNPGFLAGIAR